MERKECSTCQFFDKENSLCLEGRPVFTTEANVCRYWLQKIGRLVGRDIYVETDDGEKDV